MTAGTGGAPFSGPFPVAGDDLVVGGLPARELARRHGTPLYVYDLEVIEARYGALRAALPAAAEVCFAIKANPSLAVCAFLRRLGAGGEAASRGELLLARRAGFAPDRVVMAGPAKTAADHGEALAWGIRAVNLESVAELGRLDRLAAEHGYGGARRFPVGLRLNTRHAIEEERSIIGGAGPRKFGLDEEEAKGFVAALAASGALRLAGIHVFNASNVRDAALLADNARRILALAAEVAAEAGSDLEYVDVGGGLGIPYAAGETPIDLAALGRGLGETLAAARAAGPLRRAALVLEPGRYLVGEAGVYLTTVLEVKRSRGRRIALVDGGIHHLVRPALVGAPHPMIVASRAGESPAAAHDVGGTLCTGLDFLGKEVMLPEVRPGDLLAVLSAGAYGFTESMPLFLSHPAPPEVVARGGEAWVVRRREMPEERIERQSLPEWLA